MITLNCKRGSRDHQRGIALLMALIALLIIGAITAGAILLANTETSISSNFRDEQLAFFSAKAGIEEGRDRMRAGITDTLRTGSLPTTLPGASGSVLYILNPANGETVAPQINLRVNDPAVIDLQTGKKPHGIARTRDRGSRIAREDVFRAGPARVSCRGSFCPSITRESPDARRKRGASHRISRPRWHRPQPQPGSPT